MKLILVATLTILATTRGNSGHNNEADEADLQAIEDQLRYVFRRIDTNNDGGLTLDENIVNFNQIDTNDDGIMDYDEFATYRKESHCHLTYTDEQLIATYLFYDTLNDHQPKSDSVTQCDVAHLFNAQDSNVSFTEGATVSPEGDGNFTQQEFDQQADQLVQDIAQFLPNATATVAGPN